MRLEIQWYPGHMAKAKRLLSAQLSKVDLVVELCDARLPLSSRNPALDELIRHKRRVLLLCKADLAEPAKTQRWLAYFRRQGVECMAYDKSPQKTKQARGLIELAARDVLERNQRRGIQKTLRNTAGTYTIGIDANIIDHLPQLEERVLGKNHQ